MTIYRLISEKTIEENILKKAAQKRRLGEMAIDEAGFTPEFFRQTDNVRDLFMDDEQVRDIVALCHVPDNQKDLQEVIVERTMLYLQMALLGDGKRRRCPGCSSSTTRGGGSPSPRMR